MKKTFRLPRCSTAALIACGVFTATPMTAAANNPVEVVSEGQGEKFTLRLAPKNGHKQTVVTTVNIEKTQMMGEIAVPASRIPAVRLVEQLEVTEVARENITYRFQIKEATFQTKTETTERLSGTLTGLSGQVTLNPTGQVQDVKVQSQTTGDPKDVKTALNIVKEAFNSAYVPLPAQAVGVGATWKTKSTSTKNGKLMDNDATYELVSADKMSCTIRQTSGNSDKKPRDLKIDFTAVAPKAGAIEHRFTSKGQMELEGENENLSLITKTKMVFSSL